MPAIPAELPKREEVIQLAKALKDAKNALGVLEIAEANRALERATKLAKLEEHQGMVTRLKYVADYCKQFRDAMVAAARDLDGGETFMVGSSTVVAMVESSDTQVTFRVAGQNITSNYGELKPGLAVALAELKLDNADPVTRVVKGAYVIVHQNARPDEIEKGKTWWDEAALGGVDLKDQLPFLTDNYDTLVKDFEALEKKALAKPAGEKPSEDKPAEAKPDAPKSEDAKDAKKPSDTPKPADASAAEDK